MPTNFDPDFFNKTDFASHSDAGMDDELWALLSVYIDGEASAEEAGRVEAMLHTDPAYAREFAFLKMASSTVRSFTEVEPPASLRDSIFAATTRRQSMAQRAFAVWIDFRHKFTPQVGRFAMPTAAFAGAALVAAVFVPGLMHSNTTGTHVMPGQTDRSIALTHPSLPAPVVEPTAPVLKPVETKIALISPVSRERSVPPFRYVASLLKQNSFASEHTNHAIRLATGIHPGQLPKHKFLPEGHFDLPYTNPDNNSYVQNNDPSSQKPQTFLRTVSHPMAVDLGPDVTPNTSASSENVVVTSPTIPKEQKKIMIASLTSVSPDMRRMPTGRDIAKMSEDARLNYSPEVVRGSERGEATVSLVSHF